METTAVHPPDVSALDESTALGVRDWIWGARTVLGTIAASTLLVVACGLFVIDPGSLGRRHDVGQRPAVQLQPTQLRHERGRAPTHRQSANARVDAARRPHLPAISGHARTVNVDQTPATESAVTPTPRGDAPKPAPGQEPPPLSAAPAPAPTSPTTTPQLPAPLDELPLPSPIPLPTVVVPSMPDVPALPDVSTTTSIVGVP